MTLSVFRRLVLVAVLTVLVTSCAQVKPLQRTLPDWVRRVYVPMAKNETYEPGLEEEVTNAFITELQADGRLEVTAKRSADVVLQVVLKEYAPSTASFESDEVASRKKLELEASLAIYAPEDLKNPLGTVESIPVSLVFDSDYRSYTAELEVDARERLAEATARALFTGLMTNANIK